MSAATGLDLGTAAGVADAFGALLADAAERVVAAGAIRRRAPVVGDIDLLACPRLDTIEQRDLFGDVVWTVRTDLLDRRLAELLAAGTIGYRRRPDGRIAWGPHWRSLTFEGVGIDLFTPQVARWGWILALRTGPAAFSRQLVTPVGRRSKKEGRDGLLPLALRARDGWLTRGDGARVSVPEERDVFDLFGLAYLEPWERT
jgi:DNA polymerase/3'-5' exonuclease PolX